jgi:DNA helicase-2/ATP-dependent DNA helicase PcrA
MKDETLPPMLRAEYSLYQGLKERGLPVHAQHLLGEYVLDIAAFEPQTRKRRDDGGPKLDIECDIISTLDGTGSQGQAKRSLLLLNDGWNIVRFSIGEIESDLNGCVDAAMEVWQQGRKKSLPGRLLSGQTEATVPELPVDDDVQRLAITHGGGPAAVDGGAGTGKSSCVTHRVANLLAQGISPEKILVLSQSNETLRALKAAVEIIGDKLVAQRVNFYSWHDFGHKILKENLSAIKRKPPLKIENNPQKVIQRLLAKYRKELDPTMLELSEELDEFTIASLIALYKANLITPKHLKERCKTEVDELVAKVYQGYEEQLLKSNKIDRDDMISLAAITIADQPEVRSKYQFAYEYILSDEYQEATAASDLLMRLLAFPQDSLFVSGNEDEAIYESKGGLPRLMSELSIKLPNARCYMLEKNWRSHPTIVECSKKLLGGLSRRRIQKDMTPGWGVPPTPAIVGPQVLDNETAEAEWVANEASILIDSGRSPQDIAVLYRYHRYGLIVEESMSQRGIRCVTTHPEAGMIPDEVGDVMAFLRLVMDPDGPKARESFERVCQLRVKEVDPKLSTTIAGFAEANNLSYLKAIEIYSEAVAEPACKDLEQLVRIIRTMHSENTSPGQAIALWKRTQRLNEYYKSIKVPPGVNYEPMRKLAHLEEEAFKFKSVSEFVKAQAVPTKPGDGEESDHVLHILTLHEAKGKEFPVVFLVGLAEGLFPAESASDREEERRLCYVGFTRAKELLYLSYPAIFNEVALQPSTFLFDAGLMQRAVAVPEQAPAAPPASTAAPASQAPVQPAKAPVQQPPQLRPAPAAAAPPAVRQAPNQPSAQPVKPAAAAPAVTPVQPQSLRPTAPVPQQQGVRPTTPVPQQQGFKPVAPVPQQQGAKPAASAPQQQGMMPATPVPQQQGVKPATPVPQQQGVRPATPVPQQQGVKPAAPVPQQQGATPATPVPQQPTVKPVAPAQQQQGAPLSAPVPQQQAVQPTAPVPQQPAVKPVAPAQQQQGAPSAPVPQQQGVKPAAPVPQQQAVPPSAPVPQQPAVKPAAPAQQQQGAPLPAPVPQQQEMRPAAEVVLQPGMQPAASVPPQEAMKPAALVPETPVQEIGAPGRIDVAFKGEKTPPAMAAVNLDSVVQAAKPQGPTSNSKPDSVVGAPQPQADAPAAVHIKPAPAAHSPYIPARPGMPREAAPVHPNPAPTLPPTPIAAQTPSPQETPLRAPVPPALPQQAGQVQPNSVPHTPGTSLHQEELPDDWFERLDQKASAVKHGPTPMSLVGQAEEAAPLVGPPPVTKPEPALEELEGFISPSAPHAVPGQPDRSTAPKGKTRQSDEEFIDELLSEPSANHNAKRTLPTDTYWQRRRSTPQPQPQSEQEQPAAAAELEELDTSLDGAPAIGYVPPPGHHIAALAESHSSHGWPSTTPVPVEPEMPEQVAPARVETSPVEHFPTIKPITALQCPQCTAPLEGGSRFCGECGYQLPVKIPACHLCGAPLEPTAKFCGECGSPQSAHPPTGDADKPTQRSWLNRLTKLIDE